VNFWKFELNRMIEDVRNETDLLVAQKKRLTNSLDATEAPLHIATECLANRDRRYGEDRVSDAVEIALLKEVEIINNVQNLLRQTILTAEQQIRANRNAKQNLEMDWSNKWEASVADAKATNRRNEDVDIMFYPGVARSYDKCSILQQKYSIIFCFFFLVNRHRNHGHKILMIILSTVKIN